MTTYSTADAQKATLAKIGATWAVRSGARGPNGKAKRGTWTVDGRDATAAEARALNAVDHSGIGARMWEAKPGSISMTRAEAEVA